MHVVAVVTLNNNHNTILKLSSTCMINSFSTKRKRFSRAVSGVLKQDDTKLLVDTARIHIAMYVVRTCGD